MRTRHLLVLLTLVVATVLGTSIPASAHAGDQSYLYLDVGESLQARLQMPFPDVEDVLGIPLDIDDSPEDIAATIEANEAVLREYAADHVALGLDGTEWVMTPIDVGQVEDINYVEVVFEVAINGPVPDSVTVTFDPFFDEIDDRDAIMLVGNDWRRGFIDTEEDQLVRLEPNQRTATVEFGDASQWKNFSASLGLGVDHIRTGPDHMLFVFALLIPSVLIWRESWKPSAGFGSTLLRITKIMTMFTLAHSVTFTLTGIGAVPSPGPKVTETIIALSIAATALHNLKPIIVNREWVIALVFGLFHGFGFASLVQDLDVSTTTQLVSLAGRNVGIELGQLFVVLLCFPALFLLRRTKYYRPFFVASSIVLIIVSLGWAIERIWGGVEITSKVIDEVTEFPRVLILLAVATAVAGGLFVVEQGKGQLIDPVHRKDTSVDGGAEARDLVGSAS